MSKVVNITDKLSKESPQIIMGENKYIVNDVMSNVLKFEELTAETTKVNIVKSIELALGVKACKEIDPMNMSIENYKVLCVAIMAAMQGLSYDEAEKRFRPNDTKK